MTLVIKPYTPIEPIAMNTLTETIEVTGWSDGSIRLRDIATDEVMDFTEKQAKRLQKFLNEWFEEPEEGED